MNESYVTVSAYGSRELIINKSRFIGYMTPCDQEQDAIGFLQKIREEHRTATHHCYAYIIGKNSGIMRYSDDGEPGGTAGLPILDVLRTKEIVNCCAVVVRYFGGVLLGTGGLVRAYTQATQGALESAGISRMERSVRFDCALPYPVWDKFRYASEHLPVKISSMDYGSDISFSLYCRTADQESVLIRLMDASDRMLRCNPQEELFFAWKET